MNPNRTFIIAEAGVNHNGSLDLALKLVDVAADSGADAIKFQSYKSEKIVGRNVMKADYQKSTTSSSENQFDMLKRLELTEEMHHQLIKQCQKRNIQFISTPFDLESANLLIDVLDVPVVKIPSGEIINGPLLLHLARKKKPVILSTGMSDLGEIEQALGVLAFGYADYSDPPSRLMFKQAYLRHGDLLKKYVSLLHCTSEYPSPFEDMNLRAIDTLGAAFGLKVGLSDHSAGLAASIAAVARGAQIIEKHFTLDRDLPGPDHRASIEPSELKLLVESIRNTERSLGSPRKFPAPSEINNMVSIRKSIVASKVIKKGELFSEANIAIKRPGNGISPMHYWDVIGKPAPSDFDEDDVIYV